MLSELTDVSSFDTVIGPVPTDIRNASAVRSYLQTLANRTRYLLDRFTALADIPALKALTSPADGTTRFVKSKGAYTFDASSVAAEVLPFVVQPNVGSGRWLHELYTVQAQANGLATLDGSGKLTAAQVPTPANRIMGVFAAHQTANLTVPGTFTWTDALTLAIANCAVGDIIHFEGYASMTTPSGGNGRVRLAIDDGGVIATGREEAYPTNTDRSIGFAAVRTVATAGTVTVRLQGYTGSSSVVMKGNADPANPRGGLTAIHVRP